MIDKVEGIIVSELDYGETSKIINVLTKDLGIIFDIKSAISKFISHTS